MSICISGQQQEFLGFANYITYQTLMGAKKLYTSIASSGADGVDSHIPVTGLRDYEIIADQCSNIDEQVTAHGRLQLFKVYTDAWVTSKSASELATQVASDVSAINTSWGDALTVDTIIYNIGPGANGTNTRGCTWKRHYGGTDAIDSSHYDKVIGASDKHISVAFSDMSDASTHWSKAMSRHEAAVSISDADINWNERGVAFARNRAAIDADMPTTNADHVLNIDKILSKDATEYAALCTFIGKDPLSTNTWHNYVDSYLTYIA